MEIHVPLTQPMYCSKGDLSAFFGSVKSRAESELAGK